MTQESRQQDIHCLVISTNKEHTRKLCSLLEELSLKKNPTLALAEGEAEEEQNLEARKNASLKPNTQPHRIVVDVATLAQAPDRIAAQFYEVIFLDFREPEMVQSSAHALSVIDEFSREAPGVSLVALIDPAQEAHMPACLARGLADYIADTELTPPLVQRVLRYALSRKQSSKKIFQLLRYDTLTGLSNRHLCADRISQAMIRAERSGLNVAVLLVDIDNFHGINETLGYDVGDHLLQETAQRLVSCVRRQDTVSRFGSDEFVMVLEGLNDPQHATVIAKQILQNFSEPIFHQEKPIFISMSIGISVSEPQFLDGQALLKQADIARYRAKEHGGSNFQYYVPELNSQAQKQLNLERELNHALKRIFSKKGDA